MCMDRVDQKKPMRSVKRTTSNTTDHTNGAKEIESMAVTQFLCIFINFELRLETHSIWTRKPTTK